MGRGDRRDEVAQLREVVVADDHLRRTDGQCVRRIEGRVTREHDVLRQPTIRHGLGQEGRATRVGERRGVGDPGDAAGREAVPDGGQIEGRGGPHRGQRLVLTEDPARRGRLGADLDACGGHRGERGRVQDPEGPRCVLDPHGNRAGPVVEPGSVDTPARGVMAHGSEPLARRDIRRSPAHGPFDAAGGLGQIQRSRGRGHGQEVEVVVVETGQHRSAVDVPGV